MQLCLLLFLYLLLTFLLKPHLFLFGHLQRSLVERGLRVLRIEVVRMFVLYSEVQMVLHFIVNASYPLLNVVVILLHGLIDGYVRTSMRGFRNRG